MLFANTDEGIKILRFSAIWKYDTGTSVYTDLTSNTQSNTAFNFISASTNVFFLGLERRFTGIYLDLSTNGAYTVLSLSYKADSGWKNLSLIDSYTFTEDGYQRWVLPNDWIKFNFTDTDPYSASVPDNVERYWIKITATTVTTTAVISKIRAIPYALYTTPEKVAQFMQIRKDFDNDTNPTDLTVEDFIKRSEDRIDYLTKKSWKFNIVSAEETDPRLVDYNRYGVFLRHRNFIKVYSVSIWTGNAWQVLTEGRENDYFVNYDLGVIYFTRLFLLPAAYGMTGRYFHWGFGEYKFSCKVLYSYGRDWETNSEAGIVENLATKMAAKDLWLNHDYSSFIVSGSDKVPIESKIRELEVDIEKQIEELIGISVY